MTAEHRATQVMEKIQTLASFSAMQDGILRAYLTEEHRQAHQQLARWMTQAGLETWQDEVGNQWGRKVAANPELPTLIIGSHSDTVANAGGYDGPLGILLAIEALDALQDTELPFHVDVVAFADEEGTRFQTTLLGSSPVAGLWNPALLDRQDAEGISIGEAMRHFGLEPDNVAQAARKPEETLAYLEVHIEQGPLLESLDLPVGVVTAIAGAKRFLIDVSGVAGHAGTVPLPLRHDALCGVAQMIATIEAFATEHEIVATVGKCDVRSAAVNVIPGQVQFSLDIRSQSQEKLDRCTQLLMQQLATIGEKRGLNVVHEQIYQAQAVPCSDRLQQLWAQVVESATGKDVCYLASGAGHDAMVMANLADMGMLFVRCEKGISHNPKENVQTQDVAVALDCLIRMIQSVSSYQTGTC
ncbi:N-carbamoyl-L-amino acid hydrolase [Vibrio mangrovi]|nr:N-carbamoyl-L-amino acid hydrolase [Vibrio mangrovi]